jgi:hypothetical protein
MTREKKCEILIKKGYTYDLETGYIYNRFGKMLNAKCEGYMYISININKKNFKLKGHHFAWYCVYGNCDIDEIDHINGITDDNRICNLRNVNHNQNMWNLTKAKGYNWHKKSNKWTAQIQLNKQKIHLGLYTTEQEAKQAYLNAKEKYHII